MTHTLRALKAEDDVNDQVYGLQHLCVFFPHMPSYYGLWVGILKIIMNRGHLIGPFCLYTYLFNVSRQPVNTIRTPPKHTNRARVLNAGDVRENIYSALLSLASWE